MHKSSCVEMSETESQLQMDIQSLAVGTQASQNDAAVAVAVEVQQDLDNKKEEGRKEMASRSEMWDHFIKIKDENKILKSARCKYCCRILKSESKGHGTSSLKRHFEICKRNPHRMAKDPKQGTIQACHGEAVSTWKFDQAELRIAFAEMIIEDEQPFCFGEKPGLRKFMAKACPRFQLPSRRTCTRDVVRCFFQEKAKLMKFFKESCQRVCLTTDCWTSQQQDSYMTVGQRMKDKFDKYWGLWHTSNRIENENGRGKGKEKEKENINLLIFIAACLDPRYKLSLCTKIIVEEIFGEERAQLVWEAIVNCVHGVFEEYRTMYGTVEETIDVSDATPSMGGRGRGSKLQEVIAKRMKLGNGSSSNVKSELEKYLAEATEDTQMKVDLLVWWKASEQRFPVLSRMARDLLAIPISSVASESAFSTGGRILDDFRSSLTPFMLEALVCTQDWLRWAIPLDIQENAESLTLLEKELREEFDVKGKGKQQSSTIGSNTLTAGTSTS